LVDESSPLGSVVPFLKPESLTDVDDSDPGKSVVSLLVEVSSGDMDDVEESVVVLSIDDSVEDDSVVSADADSDGTP